MGSEIALIRYGLLMAGQPLEDATLRGGRSMPGHFWGTLFEGRQELPLANGATHYPVALLSPPKARIRCQVSSHDVSDTRGFWDDLFAKEMCYPQLPADASLMRLAYTPVFLEDGSSLTAAVFVLNPLFYLFHRDSYGMHLTEATPTSDGFVSWLDLVG